MSALTTRRKTKKGHNVVITGDTHKSQIQRLFEVDGIKYTLFEPQRNCTAEMSKPLNKTISEIATREKYAKNGDSVDVWIRAIQNVFDNHRDDIKGLKGFKEFHKRKVYFYNPGYGNRGFCMYLAVQRKDKPDKKPAPKQDSKMLAVGVSDEVLSDDSSSLELLSSESEDDGIEFMGDTPIGQEDGKPKADDSDSSLSLIESDIESEEGDAGPIIRNYGMAYRYTLNDENKGTENETIVYKLSDEKKINRLYNKTGDWIGNLIKTDDGTEKIESKEVVMEKFNKMMKETYGKSNPNEGGRKKKRRTKKKRKRKRTKKKRKRKRRKTRK